MVMVKGWWWYCDGMAMVWWGKWWWQTTMFHFQSRTCSSLDLLNTISFFATFRLTQSFKTGSQNLYGSIGCIFTGDILGKLDKVLAARTLLSLAITALLDWFLSRSISVWDVLFDLSLVTITFTGYSTGLSIFSGGRLITFGSSLGFMVFFKTCGFLYGDWNFALRGKGIVGSNFFMREFPTTESFGFSLLTF